MNYILPIHNDKHNSEAWQSWHVLFDYFEKNMMYCDVLNKNRLNLFTPGTSFINMN